MTRSKVVVFLSLIFLVCSCSTISLKTRNGLDVELEANSFDQLRGNFNNTVNDTMNVHKTLYSNFNDDTIYIQKNLIVSVAPIDRKTIKLTLLDNETVIDSLTISGRYRRGYFKIKRQWSTRFIAGPMLWVLGDNFKYLGVTKENKLVILDSGGGGVMLLLALPIFAAGGRQTEVVYERQ